MNLARIIANVRFEFRRTATLPRLAWWAVLAFLPVVIVSLLIWVSDSSPQADAWPVILFTLIPIIVCMLGLLLWATPIVNSELEGNTWPYLAVRPYGRTSVLLGKYVMAITWTALAAWTGLTVSVLVIRPERAFTTWLVLAVIVLLSSIAYGALFTFIGVLIHKRPIVAAVAYALILEGIVAWIPAMINQFTIQLRLRTLLFMWIDWERPPSRDFLNVLSGTGPAAKHVLILLVASAALLAASVWLLRQKTLVTGSDA